MKKKILFYLLVTIFSLFFVKCSYSDFFSDTSYNRNEKLLIMIGDDNVPMKVVKNNIKAGDVFLRLKSKKILINSKITDKLIKRMRATLKKEKGVGIAGPQVGISRKIIWVQRFDKEGKPFEVYLNPQIDKYSKEKKIGWEGCLSIPAGFGKVSRSKEITIEYDKQTGEHLKETVKGFTAVIFQHEIDHLNGILFIDRKEKGVLIPKEKYRKMRRLKKLKVEKN